MGLGSVSPCFPPNLWLQSWMILKDSPEGKTSKWRRQSACLFWLLLTSTMFYALPAQKHGIAPKANLVDHEVYFQLSLTVTLAWHNWGVSRKSWGLSSNLSSVTTYCVTRGKEVSRFLFIHLSNGARWVHRVILRMQLVNTNDMKKICKPLKKNHCITQLFFSGPFSPGDSFLTKQIPVYVSKNPKCHLQEQILLWSLHLLASPEHVACSILSDTCLQVFL